MPSNLSRRLTASDAAFLYLERPTAPLHIGSLGVFEGRISFDRFVRHMEARIPLVPRYRQRLAFVPLSLAHPTWEDDPNFAVRNHLHYVTLPAPGNEAQLREMTTKLFADPLDRNKPLWETYVIDGLEGNRSGVISKVHHCMIDGVSGMELLTAVLDISPEPAPAPDTPPYEPKPLPTTATRLSDGLRDDLQRQRELWLEFHENLLHPERPIRQMQDLFRALRDMSPWLALPAPRTPFRTSLSGRRSVAFTEVSFVELREIRTVLGGTVNDVVLAVLTGALHRYLPDRGCPVSGLEVRVAVPVNVRLEEEQGGLGNRVSAMIARLPVYESDTVRRLETIKGRITHLKHDNQARAVELLIRMLSRTPVPLQVLTGQMMFTSTVVNLICTNVPGPMIPLYSVGHLMLEHYPLVPLSLDMGLGVGVTSYNQRLFFGLMAEPKAAPDIDRLKQCVDDAFLELRAAAGVTPTDLPSFGGNGAPRGAAVPAAEEA